MPSRIPKGYRLESARLLGRNGDRTVHLRYFDGLSAISLFEEPAGPGANAAGSPRADQQMPAGAWEVQPPFWSYTWRQQGLVLTLVSALPPQDLIRVAKSVKPLSPAAAP